ncbi:MAG: hypothetical protein AB1Z98_16145 [Nannocystaceae bacterium]
MPTAKRLYVNFKVEDLMITMSHDQYDSEDCPHKYSLDDCSPCSVQTNCEQDSTVSERFFLDPGDLRTMSKILTTTVLPVMESRETMLPQGREGLEMLEKKLQSVLRVIAKHKASAGR